MDEADLRQQAGPHVFVDDLDAPVLDVDDRNHLERSLRLRAGDALTISDAQGAWRCAIFGDVIEPTGSIHLIAERPVRTIAVAITKGVKPELVVQKTTEVGIDRIVLFEAERSVARWDTAKWHKNIDRLTRIAREAAMQSRQVRVPEVVTATLAELEAGAGFVRADFGGRPVAESDQTIAIGPEGGWSPREQSAGASVDLGPTVLRAETAAIVAAFVLCANRPG